MFNKNVTLSSLCATVVVIASACSSSTNEEVVSPRVDYDTTQSHGALFDRSAQVKTLKVEEAMSARPELKRHIAAADGVSLQLSSPMPSAQSPQQLIKLHPAIEGPTTYPEQRENYAEVDANPIKQVASEPTTTFSVDIDTGAYANVRRFINFGNLPPENAVRVEEMINYFSYDYQRPDNTSTPFAITTELATTPWNSRTNLLHVGLQGYEIDPSDRPAANLIFLIDVSGSMSASNKLGLVKPAMNMLVDTLTEKDTVGIVVYAGASGAALEPTSGDKKASIRQAISSLRAGGSTNGRAGIELAYAMAAENFEEGAANRVILVTDGDFNVGTSDVDQLKSLIEKKRESGIALTTLGFGQGNYNDHLMEQLADVGNGAYAYIDNLNEARKVLVDEVSATLLTIAKDVKIQIEFNPALVTEYRLIGYENRSLANEDFANDSVDAGDIGAGHSVTAVYEIALVGSGGQRHSPSRYGKNPTTEQNLNEIAELRLRYKRPSNEESELITRQISVDDIKTDIDQASDNFRFSAAVAAFGQRLGEDKYLDGYTHESIVKLANDAKGQDKFGYRQEFINLVRLADALKQQLGSMGVKGEWTKPRG